MGFALALFALFMYSTNIMVTKLATGTVDFDLGVTLAAGSNVAVGLVLFVFQLVLKGPPLRLEAWAVALFLTSGVFSTYLGRWFFFATIQRLGPAKASAFQVSNPLFTVLIAWVFLGEALRPRDLVSVAVTLTGLFLVSYVPGTFERGRESSGRAARALGGHLLGALRRLLLDSGALLALASSSSYAVANVLRGAAIHRWEEPILGGTLGAAVGLAVQAIAYKRGRSLVRDLRSAPKKGVVLYSAIGLFTIVAQVSTIQAMATVPIGVTNLITMSTPLLVTPASYFLLKNQEGISGRTLLGIVLVLSGIGAIVLR